MLNEDGDFFYFIADKMAESIQYGKKKSATSANIACTFALANLV